MRVRARRYSIISTGHRASARASGLGGASGGAGQECYLVGGSEYWRASPAIPLPVGYPDCGRRYAAVVGLPLDTGEGEVDCALFALQNAAASSAGPGTWLLAGIALWGTGWRG